MTTDKLSIAQEKTFKSVFGEFECKIPSLPQRLVIEKRKRRYSEELTLPSYAWDLIDTMATLDVVAVTSPFKKNEALGGWIYDDLYDADAFIALGKEVIQWIDDFRDSVRKQQK